MRFSRISAFVLAVGLAGVGCSGGEGPTLIEIDIEHLRIENGCATIVGASCQLTAVAMTADSIIIPNPILRWSSNNSSVASVTGESSTVTVRGNGFGDARITVSNTTGSVTDDVVVHVLRCSKC